MAWENKWNWGSGYHRRRHWCDDFVNEMNKSQTRFGSDIKQWKQTKQLKKPVKLPLLNQPTLYDFRDVVMETVDYPGDPFKSKLIVRIPKIDYVEVFLLKNIIFDKELMALGNLYNQDPEMMRLRIWETMIKKAMIPFPYEILKYSF